MHTDVRVERVKGECNLFFASVGKRIKFDSPQGDEPKTLHFILQCASTELK